VVPYLALSCLSLSSALPCKYVLVIVTVFLTVPPAAPVLAAETVVIQTSTIFVPALGICGIFFAMAACCLLALGGFYGLFRKYTGRYSVS
jgi:hypothetical protein